MVAEVLFFTYLLSMPVLSMSISAERGKQVEFFGEWGAGTPPHWHHFAVN
jgi:hypothetical protein